MAKNKVFIDTSILISALVSQRGASYHIIYNFWENFELQINDLVLKEAINVINKKFEKQKEALKLKLFLMLEICNIKILPNPSKNAIFSLTKFLSKEDAVILATALEKSNYLITLDKDFLKEEIKNFAKKKNLEILRPKDFIEKFRTGSSI